MNSIRYQFVPCRYRCLRLVTLPLSAAGIRRHDNGVPPLVDVLVNPLDDGWFRVQVIHGYVEEPLPTTQTNGIPYHKQLVKSLPIVRYTVITSAKHISTIEFNKTRTSTTLHEILYQTSTLLLDKAVRFV